MSELENSYFDITSRFWTFCRMWYVGYHGFETIIQLSTGKNDMQTSKRFQFMPIVPRRVKTLHPAAVPSSFEVGSSSNTFIQYLERKSGWKPYNTYQRTP